MPAPPLPGMDTDVQQAGAPSAGNWQLRCAVGHDLPGVAAVYMAAFPASVEHYTGVKPLGLHPEADSNFRAMRSMMTDAFAVCLAAEPEAFIVAERDGRLGGYIFAPESVSHVRRVAFVGGYVLRMPLRLLTGRYGPAWRAVWLSVRNALSAYGIERRERRIVPACEARVLSVAVHPDFGGQGLGRRLVEAGLAYLRSRRVSQVRLEVRPDNVPALRLYRRLGFIEAGETRDSQGPWLVMLASLSEQPPASAL